MAALFLPPPDTKTRAPACIRRLGGGGALCALSLLSAPRRHPPALRPSNQSCSCYYAYGDITQSDNTSLPLQGQAARISSVARPDTCSLPRRLAPPRLHASLLPLISRSAWRERCGRSPRTQSPGYLSRVLFVLTLLHSLWLFAWPALTLSSLSFVLVTTKIKSNHHVCVRAGWESPLITCNGQCSLFSALLFPFPPGPRN